MPIVDPGARVVRIVGTGSEVLHAIAYDDLAPSDWGYIYERHVAVFFEAEGYSVACHGLSTGFLDGGIDLIVSKDQEALYLQCKYIRRKKLTQASIEWVLYKASGFLTRQYRGDKLSFGLVVPSISAAFSKSGWVARYFLSKNAPQNKVILKIYEIPMER